VWFVERPFAALGVLAIAGLSDVLDGWYARRYGQVTITGTLVDPITDKFFVLVVVVTLALTLHLDMLALLLLSTRELGELPLVIWYAFSSRARRARKERPSANLPGKLATLLQFASIGAALLAYPQLSMLLWATAAVGAVAAVVYWRRALML
jgi:CDP-diacylglycerol--glycerol-3-phosphate 3-phosphatidyltransferase/cardiolipin synthase